MGNSSLLPCTNYFFVVPASVIENTVIAVCLKDASRTENPVYANAKSRPCCAAIFLGTFGAFNYGGGVKMFFTDNVGIRVDYRRFAIQTDIDDPNLEIPIVGDEINTEPDIDRFFVGLALRW